MDPDPELFNSDPDPRFIRKKEVINHGKTNAIKVDRFS